MASIEVLALRNFVESPSIGAIKIGRTDGDVRARMIGLQTGCPDELRILGVIRNTAPIAETALHRMFKHLRRHREWFTASPELLGFIATHATQLG